MPCRSGGIVCRSPGMFDFNRGSVWGDKDMRKKVWYPVSTDLVGKIRIRMRSVTCSVFFHLTPLYISDIFWNIIQSWFGLFCLVQSLFKLDTSINPVNAFLLWMPRAYHLSLKCLMTLQQYFMDELVSISLSPCQYLTKLTTRCNYYAMSRDSTGKTWTLSIPAAATKKDSSSLLR